MSIAIYIGTVQIQHQ